MSSTNSGAHHASAQHNPQDFQPHQNHLDANSHLQSTSSHNLPVTAAAAAAGYANANQLAGLVEAATAAAGQDVTWTSNEEGESVMAGHRALQHHLDGYTGGMHMDDGFGDATASAHFGALPPGAGGPGRLLRSGSSVNGLSGQGLTRSNTRKRKRGGTPPDPSLDPAITGVDPGQHFDGSSVLDMRDMPPQQTLSDARAAGVHSAAALFRRPSSNSKKYTRPPMAKLFTSLELSPENFLHLQAAAKAYMLDDNHPERRDCVGQRGKGDTEMVKLRLWNCVRDFLEQEGNGERFFGEHAANEGIGPRQMFWPRDQHKIIPAVIPLLRRMVTNERQRQYAIETRKGGASDEKRRKTGEHLSRTSSMEPMKQMSRVDSQPQLQLPTPQELPQPDGIGELSMTDLFLDGYSPDWDMVSRSYDVYNQDYQLDSLAVASGLPQTDWKGLVAAVDSHFQIYHQGQGDCCGPCEDGNIDRIIASESFGNTNWRIGGPENATAKNEFATGILRCVSQIIKTTLKDRTEQPQIHPDLAATTTASQDQQACPHSASAAPATEIPQDLSPNQPDTFVANARGTDTSPQQSALLTIHLNMVRKSDQRRVAPRFDIPGDQCPNLEAIRQKAHQHLLSASTSSSSASSITLPYQQLHELMVCQRQLNFRVWLQNGLISVQNDGEYAVAQIDVQTTEWMDGEMWLLGEIDDSEPGQKNGTV